jgi:aldehyde dehydrogenase
MQYASQNLIPVTLELGGKSTNIFFENVMEKDDDFLDKAIEGLLCLLLIRKKFVHAHHVH